MEVHLNTKSYSPRATLVAILEPTDRKTTKSSPEACFQLKPVYSDNKTCALQGETTPTDINLPLHIEN